MSEQKFRSDSVRNNKRKRCHDNDDAMIIKERENEILAFGYTSKIFNDRKAAIQVDNGNYLIPLKSDKRHDKLRIDRFDIRHLIKDDNDGTDFLIEEKMIMDEHALLEMERYKDLEYHELYEAKDDTEQESITNKTSQNTATIPYNYNAKTDGQTKTQKEIANKFKTPASMIVPRSMEQTQIIQDVVNHVRSANDGNLVEIRIQVKNSRNHMYSFLNKQDELYSFYKHVSWISNSGLANYDSSSSSEDEQDQEHDPPKDMQSTINKTTSFIARSNNSDALQQHIQAKSQDSRFDFLNPNHQHYKYFKSRLLEHKK